MKRQNSAVRWITICFTMRKPKGRRSSLDSYLGDVKPEPTPVLLRPTRAERKLIRKSWQKAERVVVDAGVDVFINMFDAFPDSKQYFPKFSDFSSAAAFRSNILLRAHSIHVISMIDQVVKSMHKRSLMDAIIVDAGKRHCDRNVTVELLKFFGPEFSRMLSIRGHFNKKTVLAWDNLFNYIVTLMARGVTEKTEFKKQRMIEERQLAEKQERFRKYFGLRVSRGRRICGSIDESFHEFSADQH